MLSIWQFYSWTFSLDNETISVKFTSDCWTGVFEKISVEYTFPHFLWNTHFPASENSRPSSLPARVAFHGPGAEKDGCFRRALHVSSLSTFQFTALISSDLQWLAKLVLVVQLWSLHKISDQKKKILSKVSGELWEVCGLMVIALVSECQAVWVQALAGDIVLCSGTQHFTLSVPLSQPRCINKWVLANLNAGDNPVMDWHPIQWG